MRCTKHIGQNRHLFTILKVQNQAISQQDGASAEDTY